MFKRQSWKHAEDGGAAAEAAWKIHGHSRPDDGPSKITTSNSFVLMNYFCIQEWSNREIINFIEGQSNIDDNNYRKKIILRFSSFL
jgi:hypothetical protein